MPIPPYPDGSHNSPDNQQPNQQPMQGQGQQPHYEHQGHQEQNGAGGGAAHASAQKNPVL